MTTNEDNGEMSTNVDKLAAVKAQFWNGDGYIECREGWNDIILHTHKMLSFINPDYKIAQIKEKFGTLRYYYDYNFPDDLDYEDQRIRMDIMDAVVSYQERHSEHTCEYCGQLGSLRKRGWLKTMCNSCAGESS